jgi:hypothetical protein
MVPFQILEQNNSILCLVGFDEMERNLSVFCLVIEWK